MRLSDSQTEMGCLIVMGSAWGEWQSRQYFTRMRFRENYGSVFGNWVFENNQSFFSKDALDSLLAF